MCNHIIKQIRGLSYWNVQYRILSNIIGLESVKIVKVHFADVVILYRQSRKAVNAGTYSCAYLSSCRARRTMSSSRI